MGTEERPSLGEAFRRDPEAIARVEALLRNLASDLSIDVEPLPDRMARLSERLDRDADAGFNRDDLRTALEVGRMKGLRDILRALLGPDRVHFHSDSKTFIRFEEEEPANLEWWNRLLGKD